MSRAAAAALVALSWGCGDSGSGGTGVLPFQASASDAIYDPATFATFHLTLEAADWSAIVQTPADDTWRRCSMRWQDEEVADVAVRPSGQSTRIPGNPKPSLRLDFEVFAPGREWRGVEQVKLDSLLPDSSFMRDRLAYGIYRDLGVPAPRSAHARLYVNGDYKGVYEVEEPVKKEFAKHRWGEKAGNLYEIERHDPSLYSWLGEDPAAYVPSLFIPKTNEVGGDYRDVVGLCDALNNAPLAERAGRLDAGVMNLDGFISYVAVTKALVNFDSIAGDWGCRNHYWYHRAGTGKLEVIAWDVDKSFGATGWRGPDRTYESIWRLMDLTPATAWIPRDPAARQLYLAKVERVIDGPLAGVGPRADAIYAQIRDAVYADPYKGITSGQFDAAVAAVKEWSAGRIGFVRTEVAAR